MCTAVRRKLEHSSHSLHDEQSFSRYSAKMEESIMIIGTRCGRVKMEHTLVLLKFFVFFPEHPFSTAFSNGPKALYFAKEGMHVSCRKKNYIRSFVEKNTLWGMRTLPFFFESSDHLSVNVYSIPIFPKNCNTTAVWTEGPLGVNADYKEVILKQCACRHRAY